MARKKGLGDHYQQADGSPKPKRKSNVVEPVRAVSLSARSSLQGYVID